MSHSAPRLPFPRPPAVLLLPIALLGASSLASAESRRFNLHVDAGALLPPGFATSVGMDWQFKVGYALDAALTLGFVPGSGGPAFATASAFGGSGATAPIDSVWFQGAMGVRFRFFDNWKGYLNEPKGDASGNLFLVPRAGLALLGPNAYATVDVQAGYEWSLAKPMQLGAFVRAGAGVGSGLLAFLGAGIGFSFEIGAPLPDADHDRVPDGADDCPNTPLNTEVNRHGCAVLRQEMVLTGITFKFNSAEIALSSQSTLEQASQVLRDNPSASVEVSGHTDNVGEDAYNLRLSQARAQAVADWLIQHGVDPGRLRVRGYGSRRPIDPSDSEEARARNRRIEFLRLP